MTIPQRLHVHMNVADLETSIAYYTKLFGTAPTREKPSYAQWRLESPSVNFAISKGMADGQAGISHLGIQVGDNDELEMVNGRLTDADHQSVEDKDATCCYAKSDKYWSLDPSGIAWELFHTHEDLDEFGDATMPLETEKQKGASGGCC